MPKSDVEDSELDLSPSETQFVPQEGDSETLWEVIEITAEKGKLYKVRWVGIDPQTNKPWAQSWVPKHDVTSDLVLVWKKKRAKKEKETEKEKERRKSGKRDSTASKRGRPSTVPRKSVASSGSKESGSTATVTERPGPSRQNKRRASTSTATSKPKSTISMDTTSSTRPRKKRRIEVESESEKDGEKLSDEEEESYPVKRTSSKVLRDEDDEDERVYERNSQDSVLEAGRTNGKGKGKEKARTKASFPEPESDSEYSDLPLPPSKPKVSAPKRSSKVASSKGREVSNEARAEFWDRVPPSKSSHSASSRKKRVITPSHVENSESDHEKGSSSGIARYSPILSPRAIRRLTMFDASLKKIEGQEQLHPETLEIDERYPPTHHDSNPHLADLHSSSSKEQLPLFLPASRGQSEISDLAYPSTGVDSLKSKSRSTQHSKRNMNASYEHEMIPETESSIFNSPSQEKERAVPVTPPAGSLKSRMKPRVPGSANGSKMSIFDDDYYDPSVNGSNRAASDQPEHGNEHLAEKAKPSKPLKPIPVLSPSTFAPHLPSSAPVDSTIETAQDPLSSQESIDCFDSPDKSKRLDNIHDGLEDTEGSMQASHRGAQLAEVAQERQRLERGEQKSKKVSLHEVSRQRRRRQSERLNIVPEVQQKSHNERCRSHVPVYREPEHPEHEHGSSQLSNHRVEEKPVEATVMQEMEEAYVDLSGGMMHEEQSEEEIIVADESMYMREVLRQEIGGSLNEEIKQNEDSEEELIIPDESMYMREVLRQEEEESTQDLIRDSEMYRRQVETEAAAEDDKALLESQTLQLTPTSGYQGDDSGRVDESMQDVPQASPPSPDALRTSTPLSEASEPNHRIRSSQAIPGRSPSVASPRVEATPQISVGLHDATKEQHIHQAHPVHGNSEIPSQGPELAVMLNDKAEQSKIEVLTMELDSLRRALVLQQARSVAVEELQMQLDASRNLLASERAKWEADRASLNSIIETTTKDKLYAETDCKSIREAYNRADGFAMSLRKENAELEERAAVAENQAKVGVAAIRKTYELRVKQLEDEAGAWRRTANFLIDKDLRTNDEIRRRAAEHPQLELQIKDLDERLSGAVNNIHGLAKQVSEKEYTIRQIESERDKWKREAENLSKELDIVKASTGKSWGYRCEWRLEDDVTLCGDTFSSIPELEAHMYAAGHIQEDKI